MTDNEIIKALECCASSNTSIACKGCPFDESGVCCEQENAVLKVALDLINRQKAEIESLKAHNESLKARCTDINSAVRAFAEMLKCIYRSDKRYDRPNAHTLIVKLFDNIDSLVEELTEKGGVQE